jgi:hypothetical protein
MSNLKRAWSQMISLRFPAESACEETSVLHAELVLYDTTMAGIITTLIKTGRVPSEHVSLLRSDPELRSRLQRAATSSCSIIATDAQRYLTYLDRLEEVVRLAARAL